MPPERRALDKLYFEDILKLVDMLPNATREVFYLYAIEGYTHVEIAQKINISVAPQMAFIKCKKETEAINSHTTIMQDNYPQEFDEQFIDEAWLKMHQLLDKEMPVQPKRRAAGWLWFLAYMLIRHAGRRRLLSLPFGKSPEPSPSAAPQLPAWKEYVRMQSQDKLQPEKPGALLNQKGNGIQKTRMLKGKEPAGNGPTN